MKKFSFCIVALFVICLLPGRSIADTTAVQPQLKSPGKALAWSFWGTVIPNVVGLTLNLTTDGIGDIVGNQLGTAGIIFGPSAGYFYGGLPKRGESGMALRGGLTLGTYILILAAGENGEVRSDREPAAAWLALFALTTVTVNAITSIAKVDGAVRKRNENIRETGWLLAPKYFADHKAGGLQLQLRF